MVLFVLLAFDCAGFFHHDISSDAAALIAVVLGFIALVVEVRTRGIVP